VKKYIQSFVARFLDYLTQLIPIRVASSLEWRIQRVLGKGIGFSSLKDEIRTLGIFIEKLNLKDVILFDIGANVGQYGIEFNSEFPDSKIDSFEPSKFAFTELMKKADINQNWTCHNFGFGSEEKQLKLYAATTGSASATLIDQEQVFGRNVNLNFELVQIRKLDLFLKSNPDKMPNVVKIDIEGFELECLKGGLDSIYNFKIIQFEFGEINIDSRTYFRDYWNFFSNLGFKLFRITRGAPLEIKEYNESLETFAVTNYLAVKL
jgi:FkbM family methyltransferase